MEPKKQKPSEQVSSPHIITGCPYLGVREDAETHFSTATLGNYCHKVNPAQPVSTNHQEGFCLSGLHQTCIVFTADWEGPLPAEIRGNGPDGFRKARGKSHSSSSKRLVPSPSVVFEEEEPNIESVVLSSEVPVTVGEPAESIDRLPKEQTKVTPWGRLHDEAKDHYGGATPKRKDKIIWTFILLLATLILVVSIWGLIRQLNNQAKGVILTSNAALVLTATQQFLFDSANMTSTAQAEALIAGQGTGETPSPKPIGFEETQTAEKALTGTAQALALLEPSPTVVSCEDFTGYIIEIVSGPELSPRPSYYYDPSLPDPIVQAKWKVRNLGECEWEQILLTNSITGETTVPIIYINDEKVNFGDLEQSIKPGETVDIVLSFKPEDANSIDSDWVININSFALFDQPHLILKVKDWVIVVENTATATFPPKPTAVPKTPTKEGPSRVTPTNPSRPTEKPPTRSP